MVVNAPPKGARGKGEVNRNGNKANRGRGKPERDALATKADLLAQLTRQAEEHTRILERERAALGLPGRAAANDQANRQPPQPNNLRRRNNYHVYNDQGNKKVFDPRQIPGLGGGGDQAPGGGGGGGPPAGPGAGSGGSGRPPDEPFNQTFPDSPNFFPGRVFAIPGTIPPPPNQPQQPRGNGDPIVVAPWGEEPTGPPQQRALPAQPPLGPSRGQMQVSPRGGAGMMMPPPPMVGPGFGPGADGGAGSRGGPSMSGMPGGGGGRGGPTESGGNNNNNNYYYYNGNLSGPPPRGDFGPPMMGGGGGPYGGRGGGGGGAMGPPFGAPPFLDPQMAARLEAEAKKEAYRRELEEQIRAKNQAKEVAERKRREEEAMWEARAAASPQPWDPEAKAARRGGGGEPLRDDFGRPMANLRQRSVGGMSPQGMGAPMGFMPSPGPPGPYMGPPGPAGRLTVEIPGGGAGAFPPGPPGPDGSIPVPGMPPMPFPGGPVPYDSPPGVPGGGGPVLSPGSIPPVSPGNRRFMAAMNDLIAGPSEEQRREKEMARQRLQMDLEQQIREKKERQARERAELERQRVKEEAELQAYHAQLNAQRPNNMQRGAPSPGASPHAGQQKPQRAASAGGASAGPPPLPPRRQGKGRIIDASWLDAPKPAVLPPLSPAPQVPGGSPSAGQYVRRTSNGMPEEVRSEGGMLAPRIPGRGPSHDGAPPSGLGGTVSTMLQQLQEEQSRIREDFARQAAAMERLAHGASRVLADRDEAWRELQRVRAMLAGAPHPHVGCGLLPDLDDDEDLPVIIDTHMLPRSANAIPHPLPAPVASEVLRRGHHTDPGAHAEGMGGRGGGGGGGAERLLRGGLGRFGLGDRALSPVAEGGDGRGGGGFDAEELEPLQGLPYTGMPPRRSGIPLPPGMPGRLTQLVRPPQPRIQSVYGLGCERPPPSRYNSFFGLDAGKDTRSKGSKGTSQPGVRADGTLPALQSRRPPPLRSPPSPPILRGDVLASPPSKQAQPGRGRPAALLSGRVRSGRPQGVSERPPRGPRVPSAATHETPRSPGAAAGVKLPPMPMSARGQASQRNLEKVQSILRRGHEERLLRGLAASEDGTGEVGGDGRSGAVGYGTDELLAMAEAVGVKSPSVRARRVREPSLPGLSNVLTPRRAADFLAQGSSGGGGRIGGGGLMLGNNSGIAEDGSLQSPSGGVGGNKKGPPRAFNSDSMATYRSLVLQAAEYGGKVAGTAAAAAGTSPRGGAMRGPVGDDDLGGGGGGGGGSPVAGMSGEDYMAGDVVPAAGTEAPLVASDDDAAAIRRLSSGGEQRGDEVPAQRPVRISRRANQQQQQQSPMLRGEKVTAAMDAGGDGKSSGGGAAVGSGDEEGMGPDDDGS